MYFLQNGTQIENLYAQYRAASMLANNTISFYQQCYDAIWAFGRALNKTMTGLFIR